MVGLSPLPALVIALTFAVSAAGLSRDQAPTVGQPAPIAGEALSSAGEIDRRLSSQVARGGSRPPVDEQVPQEQSAQEPPVPVAPQLPAWLATCSAATQQPSGANGRLADGSLCELPEGGFHLRADAAMAWWLLSVEYERQFGESLCVTDAYRSLSAQQRLYSVKPGLAARPGTSNHGWGVAVDLCGGAQSFGTAQYEWLSLNAERLGWTNPGWAQRSGSRPEPWHWEFDGATPAS